jgi:hypothetical protein
VEASEAFTASYHDNYIGQSDALATAFWARFAMREVGSHDPEPLTDLKTIRTRVEELRRERRPDHGARTPDSNVAGHRGRCAYRMSLFPDECDGLCKAFSLWTARAGSDHRAVWRCPCSG